MNPGQDLIVAGYAGCAGTRIIARKRETELLTWFSCDYIRRIQETCEPEIHDKSELWQEIGATEWEVVGEGGIYTALWNLSGAYLCGIEFGLHQIPIKQETIEICERYDLNPYRLWSDNCMLLVADNGGHLVESLRKKGIVSAVIGRVNPGIKREIYYGEVRGFLDRPQEDELQKVVPEFFKS